MSSSTFRSLRNYNYRLWAAGALVSNVGTWMQRTAQDWIVLVELTHRNATAVGIVMALQFGPQLLLLPLTGLVADRFDRRKVLLTTQAIMGLLALGLSILTITGLVQLWHVYIFAFLLGCTSAFDSPARQIFVGDLVGQDDLSNAVALNSTSFNAARMIGPALAGVLIAAVGSGWVFMINAVSYVAVLASLRYLRLNELRPLAVPPRSKQSGLTEGFLYVWNRPDLRATMWALLLVATFGLNFPIFISTMSVTAFHGGAGQYGLLSSAMAIGSVTGALMAARRIRPRIALLMTAGTTFGLGCAAAAIMPHYLLFGLMLIVVGMSAQTITTSTNSFVQLSTEPALRGRVIAILLAIQMGSTPIGAPFVGWVADTLGPRWALTVAAASGLGAAWVLLRYLMKHRGVQLRFESGLPRLVVPIQHRVRL